MGRVAWFGADASPPESEDRLWIEPLLASRVSRFALLNWGEGLVVGVPAGEAERFALAAELAGWRLRRLEGVEVPPCEPYKPPLWPFPEKLWRGGVVAVAKSAGKWLRSFGEAHLLQVGELPVELPASRRALRSYASAYDWRLVFLCAAFTFPGGDRRLARAALKLKLPRLPWRRFAATPLDLADLTEDLAAGGGYRPGSRVHQLQLAPALSLSVGEGWDNSLLLCGAPGTGKSSVLDLLLGQLPEGWSALVLDPTGEHSLLAEKGFAVLRAGIDVSLNPLSLGPGAAFDIVAGVVEGVWGEQLSPIVAQTLHRAVQGARSLRDVYESAERLWRSADREDERSAAAALARRLRPMLHPCLLGEGSLPAGRVVVDESSVEREEARAAFNLTLLHAAYQAAVRGLWRGVVAIDEADRLGDSAILNRIADELRKYGVSVWAAGHSLARIARKLADAKYQLYFATTDPDTLRVVDPEGRVLPRLQPGQFLLRVRGWGSRVAAARELPARRFEPKPPLPLDAVAAKHAVDGVELAAAFSRRACEALRRFTQGSASREDLRVLRELGLSEGGWLTKLGEACLELCEEAGI
jgi:hypothetical protein